MGKIGTNAMVKIIATGLISSLLLLSELHYERAVQYTINVAESDADIVVAMNEYGFDIESASDDITQLDKVEAFLNSQKSW